MKQFTMYIVFAVCALAMAILSIYLILAGHALGAFFVPIVVSLVGMRFVRWYPEDNWPDGMFDPTTQSQAFLFGDSVALPLAFVFLTKGLVDVGGLDGFFRSWWWVAVAFAIGIAMGVVFHMMDSRVYTEAGAAEALLSPTKIWHDLVVYPVIGGSLVFAGVPQVAQSWTTWTALAILAILSWFVLGILDARRGLNPIKLHPLWDTVNFQLK